MEIPSGAIYLTYISNEPIMAYNQKSRIMDVDMVSDRLFITVHTGESFSIPDAESLLKDYCVNSGLAQYMEEGESSWYEYPDFELELLEEFAEIHRELWVPEMVEE